MGTPSVEVPCLPIWLVDGRRGITMQDPIDRERRELFVRIAIDDVATSGQPPQDSPGSAAAREIVDDDARGRAHWRGD